MAVVLCATTTAAAQPSRPGSDLKGTGILGPFHPKDFRDGPELRGGPLWARRKRARAASTGFEAAYGYASWTHAVRPWLLWGTMQWTLRGLGHGAYALSLPRHIVVGGLHASHLEVFAGAGASGITLDWSDGSPGFGMLSPCATTGVGWYTGELRVQLSAYVEYLWSWTADDHWVRGLSLSLGMTTRP